MKMLFLARITNASCTCKRCYILTLKCFKCFNRSTRTDMDVPPVTVVKTQSRGLVLRDPEYFTREFVKSTEACLLNLHIVLSPPSNKVRNTVCSVATNADRK